MLNLVGFPELTLLIAWFDQIWIQIAVAGFQLADIKIELENGTLSIAGHQYKPDISKEHAANEEYLHRGISNRNFNRTFNLADYVEVKGATIKDGILKIELERVIPEVMKPKTIEIKHEN